MIRTKGEAGSGNIVEAVRHLRSVMGEIRALGALRPEELMARAKELQAPVALVEAIEEGRVNPGSHVLVPAFGGGLSWCAHLFKWGERTTPVGQSDLELPPCDKSALELVRGIIAAKGPRTLIDGVSI